MKKGFTMIELIFVIVILGILAAVAIPRLAATRDDAEIAKAATNISTLLSDVGAFYTSQGKFATSLSEMTNVQLGGTGKNELMSAGKGCVKFTLKEAQADKKPAVIKIEAGSGQGEAICKKVLAVNSVDTMMKAKFKYQKYTAPAAGQPEKWEEAESDAGEYPVSGLSVVF